MSGPSEPASLRELRRAEIVAAARAIVAEEGLGALTFGALERRLDFTRGVVTYHFANKDDIVEAVLEDAIAEVEQSAVEAVKRAGDPSGALVAVTEAMIEGFLDHRDAGHVLVSYWSRVRSDARIGAINAAWFRRWRGFCAELVRRGQAAGAFRPDLDPETAAVLIVGQVLGVVTQATFEPGALDASAAAREASASLLLRFRGDPR